ncbi:type II toxin-antitoxin system RelE/ParE family toxin [Devosia sp. MC532]|uniref:type II toxin-antitoxin system RelE/ParE family toxin n=1 Tax=Devosia sp. MC532 TaxID=2799788 RepID=UPI0018F6D405|nr:type II toxin-antitoxin system RelE/ParE family toxin [Devosia sp. MC532]MBJ7577432.1 type II toxin-antitoxin system RelE/ParE family toxin [Devosia sp. MC532]
MRRIVWTQTALDDLQNQLRYLATADDRLPLRIVAQLRADIDKLSALPSGRPGRVRGTFEKSLIHLPYIVAYALDTDHSGDRLVILRVIHKSRLWPKQTWPKP